MNQHEKRAASEMTLPDYYERFHRPNYHAGMDPGTIKSYRESLAHWCRITTNPPLREIDCELLGQFKFRLQSADFLGKKAGKPCCQRTLFDASGLPPEIELPKLQRYYSKPLKPATVNKHLAQLQAILRKAGPPGYRHLDALGVLAGVPWTRPLKCRTRFPKNIADDILTPLYASCDVAQSPDLRKEKVTAAAWWRALIVAALTMNFRRQGLLALRWENIDWAERTVALDAEDDKKDSDRFKPLSEIMVQHLLRIRSASPLVFPWSDGKKALPANQTQFYKVWHRIQFAAGIADRKRHIKLHDLKKAGGSRLSRIASPYVVMRQLDHADVETSLCYVQVTDEQREAVEKVPLPRIFYEDFSPPATAARGG